jgi:isocitrate dehydrogenase kinase/phosphatase
VGQNVHGNNKGNKSTIKEMLSTKKKKKKKLKKCGSVFFMGGTAWPTAATWANNEKFSLSLPIFKSLTLFVVSHRSR